MLSFELTEEQKALVDETRRFTKEKIIPIAAECDRKHTFPNDVFKEAWEMGLVAPGIPTEYGGNGVGEVEHVLITEELAYGCTGIQTSFTANTLAATPILVAGNEAQKKKYLGMLTSEPIFAAYAITEPAAGSDAAGIQSRAVKDGNENYILNGEKWFSSGASVADIVVIMAKTNPEAPRHQQFSTFIVELPNPGYRIIRDIKTMSAESELSHILGGGHAEVEIKNLVVSADNLLGGEGNGFGMGQHRLAYGRLRHGMHNVAMAQRALDLAAAHITKRETFGKKLADRQAVQFMMAECATQLHRAADAAAHRLQGRKGPRPAAGKLDRQGLSGAHGPPCRRYRDSAPRRARLFDGYAAGALVHADPLAAAGRRRR